MEEVELGRFLTLMRDRGMEVGLGRALPSMRDRGGMEKETERRSGLVLACHSLICLSLQGWWEGKALQSHVKIKASPYFPLKLDVLLKISLN